ncbi:MAG: Rne/Rng family ribonuclease [Hyphomonadaceae bacterium]|nr:Rne/Rng family ribonuclease [Hyphomonadaceae bacterium]
MSKKMLIDASHPEETRVVVVDGTRVVELDYESENKRQLRGNVYLARVTRVEPSLQAAFVEFGGNRHGFLAFSEIHPDYYQIPHEDRQALIEAEVAESLEDEEVLESEIEKAASGEGSDSADNDELGDDEIAAIENENSDTDTEDESGDESDDDENGEDEAVDASDKEVEEEQEKMLGARRKRMSKRRYKIQEVIKRGQILLIQAVKEERGNKGAALTTYLSLAGRYCVLMPNTPRGGGISRKIANGSDRKRLKAIMSEMSVPQGMGVIVRTAGAKRNKAEIKRDFDYLSRLWDTIRQKTLESIAPALIHEEGNLVKRSIRDLYGKDIDNVLVQGDEAYRLAKDFIKMLMPSHAKNVQPYKDDIPLFLRYQVEQQIEACLDPVAQLKSGGYLVIHPTEALVSVDVNSGRSTKERNVERTALKTNLEAADEVARQMRLRDLAGLVVIDFIDMDENRNNRAVEKRMRDALSRDRARVQMGKISQFGLMEISRQRRRRSLLEGSSSSCEHCGGVGRKRSIESSALKAIRAAEEEGIRNRSSRIRLKVSTDVAFYLMNEKRDLLNHVDEQSQMFTEIVADEDLIRPNFEIERLESKKGSGADPLEDIFNENRKAQKARNAERDKSYKRRRKQKDDDSDQTISDEAGETIENGEEQQKSSKRKRRRGRRGGRNRRSDKRNSEENVSEESKDASDEIVLETAVAEKDETKPKKSRSRRKPTAKKNDANADKASDNGADEATSSKPKRSPKKASSSEDKPVDSPDEKPKRKRAPSRKKAEVSADATAADEKPKKSTTRSRKKPAAETAIKEQPDSKKKPAKKTSKAKTANSADKSAEKPKATKETKPAASQKEASTEAADNKTKKKGWWQKSNPFN